LFRTLAIDFGYTPAEIRAMTLHDVRLLTAASEYMPSLRMWVAAIAMAIGIEPPDPVIAAAESAAPGSKYTTGEEFARLVKMTGSGSNLEGLV
jgi:hypothetical protein